MSNPISDDLLARHTAFRDMAEVDRPLTRIRPHSPLQSGGNYSEAMLRLREKGPSSGGTIDPSMFTGEILSALEPESPVDGDLIRGVELPGLCWSEGFLGCGISVSEGGAWADRFLSWPGGIDSFLDSESTGGRRPWLEAFGNGIRAAADRYRDRFPVLQPLMRGPIDMMASAIGHSNMATAFLENPESAGKLLDVCTSLFIEMAKAYIDSVPAFCSGYVVFGIWSPQPAVRTQLDNAVLLSPELYRDHFFPRDRRIFERFDCTAIHTHSGCLHIAPILSSEPALNAIQVALDVPAGPSVEQLVPVFQEIQKTHPLIIAGPVRGNELEMLRRELNPAGLCLDLQLISEADKG